ncbi:MAG: Malto-oligosyltrehalose synthase [Nitrospira sp.]|nr:malto-oligosyltrehalose synthase [Nitrospira sp.]ULA58648.1 MAG: Malto-oligosyltrehalose synthase [Nitrospira sp.]
MPRIPVATYRLQLNHTCTFRDASRIVPYLHALGITDCYVSSILKAVPGSMHGYDLVDPECLNPELGTEEDFSAFAAALKQYDMGLLLDVVPNHMGIRSSENRWWWDVLEHGPGSRYATAFDIDWSPLKRELEDKVLLPILGEQYGAVLENQEIRLVYEDGGFIVTYFQHRFPVAPQSWEGILSFRLDELMARVGEQDEQVQEWLSILTALRNLPPRNERDPARIAERYREERMIRRRLSSLLQASETLNAHLSASVETYNGIKGDSASFDRLDALLDEQNYRLASWRVASEEINYRRFFDINELAAIRTEETRVFHESHQLVFRLLKSGVATGLRIDHVDGLYDPEHYLVQLQEWAARELQPTASGEPASLFVVVEKILGKGESLPATWPVSGTTGYDFLNLVNGLFVQSSKERSMDTLYQRFVGQRIVYEDLVYLTKKLIMRASMSSELNVLGHQLNLLSEKDRQYRDFTLNSLTHAITELIACFPVYRSYITADQKDVLDRDRTYIMMAVTRAKRRNPTLNSQVFDFVRDLLLKRLDARIKLTRADQVRFVTKFQQTTSPVTAKGIEDTAFYIYNRLVSLNEVGGEPAQYGLSVEAFHKALRERRAHWPHALLATSTHDTKRGEDVRARINVLSEVPERWRAALAVWAKHNRRFRVTVDEDVAPDRNEEYLLYQTLLGAWPSTPMDQTQYEAFTERIEQYMIKAIREAKVHTGWINPRAEYEEAVKKFVRAILDRSSSNPFLDAFLPFHLFVARCGMNNSLAQLLVKMTAPGIPDCYQGTELWEFNLVDPDNRRPVDFDRRAAILQECQTCVGEGEVNRTALVRRLMESWEDGRIKLYLLHTGLRHRREHAALYLDGDYVPLECDGVRKSHICAFARLHQEQAIVTIVPRLSADLIHADSAEAPDTWQDTRLTVPSWKAGSHYRNLLTGQRLETVTEDGRQILSIGQVLRDCPVALLERSS